MFGFCCFWDSFVQVELGSGLSGSIFLGQIVLGVLDGSKSCVLSGFQCVLFDGVLVKFDLLFRN